MKEARAVGEKVREEMEGMQWEQVPWSLVGSSKDLGFYIDRKENLVAVLGRGLTEFDLLFRRSLSLLC